MKKNMNDSVAQRIADLSIRKGSTIRAGMEAIDRGGCWISLVVDGKNKLLGLLTDGDMRRALLAGASLDDPVERYMQRAYTAVPPTAGRAEVLDIMRARSLNQIPIIDEKGKLCGLHLMREIIGSIERPNWTLIMAGGRGERLRPITDSVPKPMIKVAGRPILERIVLHLVGFGIRRIFLAVNYKAEVIEDHFGDGSTFGCHIDYLKERKPLGTGGALALLPPRPSGPVLVLNGDIMTQFDVGRMIAFHSRGGHKATVGIHEYVHTIPFGVVDVKESRVIGVREKPTQFWQTNAGIYVLEPDLLARVPKDTNFPLPTLLEECLDRKESVGAFRIDEEWTDVGMPRELSRARGVENKP